MDRDQRIEWLTQEAARIVGDPTGDLRRTVRAAYADDSSVTVAEIVEIVRAARR